MPSTFETANRCRSGEKSTPIPPPVGGFLIDRPVAISQTPTLHIGNQIALRRDCNLIETREVSLAPHGSEQPAVAPGDKGVLEARTHRAVRLVCCRAGPDQGLIRAFGLQACLCRSLQRRSTGKRGSVSDERSATTPAKARPCDTASGPCGSPGAARSARRDGRRTNAGRRRPWPSPNFLHPKSDGPHFGFREQ